MKKFLTLIILILAFASTLHAHPDEKCEAQVQINTTITLKKVFKEDSEFFCYFEGFGIWGQENQIIDCNQIVNFCNGDLKPGAKVLADIWTGPIPFCPKKTKCGCGKSSEILRLIKPKTCGAIISPQPHCEQTACGCGPGCPGTLCEDYLDLPGPPPKHCVNGPN